MAIKKIQHKPNVNYRHQEYPKLIYNNENKTCVTVQSPGHDEKLSPYFSDKLEKGHEFITYTEIPVLDALRTHEDAVGDVAAKKVEEDLSTVETVAPETDPTKIKAIELSKVEIEQFKWQDLLAFGKEVENLTGVNIPHGAKREVVEQSIKDALDACINR